MAHRILQDYRKVIEITLLNFDFVKLSISAKFYQTLVKRRTYIIGDGDDCDGGGDDDDYYYYYYHYYYYCYYYYYYYYFLLLILSILYYDNDSCGCDGK